MIDRTPGAESYFLMLVRSGEECDHPAEFRREPPFPTGDPQEWECGVCWTVQAYRGVSGPPATPEPPRE